MWCVLSDRRPVAGPLLDGLAYPIRGQNPLAGIANLGEPSQLWQTVALPKQLGDALVDLHDVEFANLIGHDHEEMAVMGQAGVHRVQRQGHDRRNGVIRQLSGDDALAPPTPCAALRRQRAPALPSPLRGPTISHERPQ
jgi:hypothetical protein